ncbi:MAG: 5-(carboxyamino)imidazole ribonucleotide mutase [Phycisphaerales bacterium]
MQPLVGVIMGSRSDWETMRHCAEILAALNIPHETKIVSAHRTPDLLFEYASSAADRGLRVIIAGAGGAAHLPGMCAAKTPLPVLGVPVESKALSGMDSLLSIAQMPGGVPVGTMAIGKAGAINAALLAARILGASDDAVRATVERHMADQTKRILDDSAKGLDG